MTGETPRVSVVVPAYNEGEHITPVLDRIFESVHLQCEVLIVVDSADDDTVPVVTRYAEKEPRLRCLINTYPTGLIHGRWHPLLQNVLHLISPVSHHPFEWWMSAS